ncbi:hypothetical protein AD05_5260 [Escherichia coli 5-366-08_S4_C2]|nr:hypothetical protein FORC31_4361 [Escherichia coli]EMV38662.1 hypothetical protein ECBCE019MS13_3297 [Escherichia coli BCE019_MS-13]EMV54307.1 hypothetical protein EC2872000_3563 [Escherichia coli 2872000]EMX22838.1 hypothetical protein ECMP0215661_3852 [Escherichia coli MP021566.1]EMZ65951.1 hypothetical protein EC2846750_3243 [Escherichia coli 2846750]ENA28739.1 hypothetical protein ECBCE007MS11_3488 [Escherichia coli BCE007_MS-11]ENA73310.1 hypothetical protein EC2730450_4870 [Escherich
MFRTFASSPELAFFDGDRTEYKKILFIRRRCCVLFSVG